MTVGTAKEVAVEYPEQRLMLIIGIHLALHQPNELVRCVYMHIVCLECIFIYLMFDMYLCCIESVINI